MTFISDYIILPDPLIAMHFAQELYKNIRASLYHSETYQKSGLFLLNIIIEEQRVLLFFCCPIQCSLFAPIPLISSSFGHVTCVLFQKPFRFDYLSYVTSSLLDLYFPLSDCLHLQLEQQVKPHKESAIWLAGERWWNRAVYPWGGGTCALFDQNMCDVLLRLQGTYGIAYYL